MKLGITSSSDGGVMFDARLHADLIRRSHSFLDIVAAFALFRRSAINLLISWHYSTILDFDFQTRAQPHYLAGLFISSPWMRQRHAINASSGPNVLCPKLLIPVAAWASKDMEEDAGDLDIWDSRGGKSSFSRDVDDSEGLCRFCRVIRIQSFS